MSIEWEKLPDQAQKKEGGINWATLPDKPSLDSETQTLILENLKRAKLAPTPENAKKVYEEMLQRTPPSKEQEGLHHPDFIAQFFDPSEIAIMALSGGTSALLRPATRTLTGVLREAGDWATMGIPRAISKLPATKRAFLRGLQAKEYEKLHPVEQTIHAPKPMPEIPTPPQPIPSNLTTRGLEIDLSALEEGLKKSSPVKEEGLLDLDLSKLEKWMKESKRGGKGKIKKVLPATPTKITSLSEIIKKFEEVPLEKRDLNKLSIPERLQQKEEEVKQRITTSFSNLFKMGKDFWEMYKNPPIVTNYKQALGEYLKKRTYSSIAVDNFAESVVKNVSKEKQEAMTNFLEAGGNIAVLQERAALTKDPGLRRGYELAMKLSPEEQAAVNEARAYFDSELDRAIKSGLLEEGIENYAYHIFDKSPKKAAELYNTIKGGYNSDLLKANPALVKQRFYATFFDAEQKGLLPKKQLGYVLASYSKALNEAINSRTFIESLATLRAPDGRPYLLKESVNKGVSKLLGEEIKVKKGSKLAREYTELGLDYKEIPHPALKGYKIHPILLQTYKPGVAKSGYPNLANILLQSKIRQSPAGSKLLNAVATSKGVILSMIPTPFHQVQTGQHAMFHLRNPLPFKALGLNPHYLRSFDELIQDPIVEKLVSRGLMVHSSSALAEFGEGLLGGGKVTEIVPYAEKYGRYLFNNYIPRLKMSMGRQAYLNNVERYGKKLSDDQISELSASQANAAFGELNYEWMGRNKTVQDVLKIIAFAPDFLESRLRFVGQALSPKGKEQFNALLRMAGTYWFASRIGNHLLHKDEPFQESLHMEYPFGILYNDHVYSLRSIVGDIEHAKDKPRSFITSRTGPLSIRMGTELLTGRDFLGRKRDFSQQAQDFFATQSPIIFSQLARDLVEKKGVDIDVINDILISSWQSAGGTRYKVPKKIPPPPDLSNLGGNSEQ